MSAFRERKTKREKKTSLHRLPCEGGHLAVECSGKWGEMRRE